MPNMYLFYYIRLDNILKKKQRLVNEVKLLLSSVTALILIQPLGFRSNLLIVRWATVTTVSLYLLQVW